MLTYSRHAVITNKSGIHARSAVMISKLAVKAASNVWLIKDGKKVDASDIFDILTLACEYGSEISLEVSDKTDMAILNNIVELIKNGFGE